MTLDFITSNIRRFCNKAKVERGGVLRCLLSELYCFVRYGCSPDDYFCYEFHKKSGFERNKFITYRRCKKIQKYNDPAYIDIFEDKGKFDKKFSDLIHREFLDLRTANEQEFRAFLEKHTAVIMKPLNGGAGKGVFKLTAEEYNSNPFKFEDYKNYIAEEIIVQHPDMSLLNPTSVNTIRVLTFKGKIISCAMRIGGSTAVVDNIHNGGFCAHIDIETGVVDSMFMDRYLKKVMFHPVTGMSCLGFKVPNWEILKKVVSDAACRYPQVSYVGWDVAITQDGVALVEGNNDSDHDIVQITAQTGLYLTIKNIAKESM